MGKGLLQMPVALVFVVTIFVAPALGAPPATCPVTYEVSAFSPMRLPAGQAGVRDLFISDELERTPRSYVRAVATVRAEGEAVVALVLMDFLRRTCQGDPVKLVPGRSTEIVCETRRFKRPVAMLRGVQLAQNGAAVTVESLRLICDEELLPEPTATVQGPGDETCIQKALDTLKPGGGVLYIPAGAYVLNNPVTIPCDNVSIYGDGAATVLEATWLDPRGLLFAVGRQNLRISRLQLHGPPITAFRGYDKLDGAAAKPEDRERTAVTTRGVDLKSCQNVRVDHCEISLFGMAGVLMQAGTSFLVDHCFFHENFRHGLGYGVMTWMGAQELTIEDNGFENQRHSINGGQFASSYLARYNRMVKDAAAVKDWQQDERAEYQIRLHEIDAHEGTGWIYAHDNFVSMRNGRMMDGARMRGNPAWIYRNVFEHCDAGIGCYFFADDVWTWDNEFVDCQPEEKSLATGVAHFGKTPPDFVEFPYPHRFARTDWWPGASSTKRQRAAGETAWAGPAAAQILRRLPEAQ